MPYLLISTQIRLECGPTFVGDGASDPTLMEKLEASPTKQLGNEYMEYVTQLPPRIVLNRLESDGWKVVQNATLIKIAAGTFLAGSTGLYLAQKHVQKKVRSLPHYSESLRIVSEHETALSAIGAPIKVGAVDLADNRHNYVGKLKSQLRIPITGSLDCGHMDVMAVRTSEQSPFYTAKIRLDLQNGIVTIYDTKDWKDVDDSLASD
ncbi:unnamed protein product [Auanema sp. JU1783]|nr:unnamed protein product [Auanema sp. JU1783]